MPQVNGQSETVLKASIKRRFKDRDGTWKSTTGFCCNEIPLAVYRLENAFEAMLGEENGEAAMSTSVSKPASSIFLYITHFGCFLPILFV